MQALRRLLAVFGFLCAAISCAARPGLAADPAPERSVYRFDELRAVDYSNLPRPEFFAARDGTQLAFRTYAGPQDRAVVLIHGSTHHGESMHALAVGLAGSGVATAFALDLRGHGRSGGPRGDAAYIGQPQDDVSDFIAHLRTGGFARLVLLGHSSGGGFALRYASQGSHAPLDGLALLAPYVAYDAPTTRPNSGGWARPRLFVIIPARVLGGIGLHWLDNVEAVRFNVPEAVRTPLTVTAYTFAMSASLTLGDYRAALGRITAPVFVSVGDADQSFLPEQFAPLFDSALPAATPRTVVVLQGVDHLGILVRGQDALVAWLRERFGP